MIEKIIIAGAGGQGIMLLGKVMAAAADKEKKYVTWLPSYGAEVRGGCAYCMVVISDEPVNSPYVYKADTLIAMNGPSLFRFRHRLKPGGLLIVNASMAENENECAVSLSHRFTDIADQLGNIKVANMVALGCYIGAGDRIAKKNVLKVISEIAPPGKKDLIGINQNAILKGISLSLKS